MNHTSNPFDLIRAADFSDEQINDYWVDFKGEGGLLSLIEPESKSSKHILGGKGSGKTHLLRYCSYPVQKLRNSTGISGLISEGYIGIFLRANILDTGRFKGRGQEDDKWGPLFNFYFELRVVEHLLEILIDLASCDQALSEEINGLTAKIVTLFDMPPIEVCSTLSELLLHVINSRKAVDLAVNNCVFTRRLDVEVSISPGALLFGIPSVVSSNIKILENLKFVYLLDEVENLSSEQQKFINSLIRHRQDPCTFRLGARLYGIKTHSNYGSDEENKEGSEFKSLYLDQLIRVRSKTDAYKSFAKELCAKRLVDAGMFESVLGVKQVIDQLPGFFDAFPSDDFYASQTSIIIGNGESKNRPYFKKLKEQLLLRVDSCTAVLSDVEVDHIVEKLSFDRAPLLEKVNIFMFYQDWFRGKSLVDSADTISMGCINFFNKDLAAKRHKTVYGHFALDLLAQMYRDYKLPPTGMYAGFDSFVRMSAGVPRNLLVILRNIYKWSSFNGETPFRGSPIPISTQSEAIKQSAGFFFEEDARPGADVPDTQLAVERLAEFLREVRFSSKPVEVSPLAFSVDNATLSEQSRRTLKLAENWSYIFKIPRGRPNANSQHLDDKFQLNPMLASKWDLPISVRGDVRINETLADAIFGNVDNEKFKLELQNSTASLKAPIFGKNKSVSDVNSQPTLAFDFGADE